MWIDLISVLEKKLYILSLLDKKELKSDQAQLFIKKFLFVN